MIRVEAFYGSMNPVQLKNPVWLMMSPRSEITDPLFIPSPYSHQSMGEVRRHNPRILVVDDNQDIMLLMRELLATRGYDVIAVPDAAQAEIEILRRPPDLILSDVVMPGKSGYELCREVKAESRHPADPIRAHHRPYRSPGPRAGNRIRRRRFSAQTDFSRRTVCPGQVAAQAQGIYRRTGDGGIRALHSGLERGEPRPLHRRPLRTTGSDMPATWDATSASIRNRSLPCAAAAICTTWARSRCRTKS